MAKKKTVEDLLNVARVTRVNNVVVNIEMATSEWLLENENDPFFFFVKSPDQDGTYAEIGAFYSPESRLFEHLLLKPASVKENE